ncbi:hypothetical protein D3C80_1022450 [compost metagenome]
MPSSAISALQRIATMASGTRMHSTARRERKVSQQNRATEPNRAASIITSARSTASLEAAMMPTLPPARRKFTPGVTSAAMIRLTSLTTWATVAPSWSVRNIRTCICWQPSVTMPSSDE